MSLLEEHAAECDVLVAGGGLAGIGAALAAARNGVKVILCHDRPVLGGNASSEVRMHMVGADASGARGVPLATEAREGGIIEEIRLETCVRNPQRSASMCDLILYDLCRAEPNLTLMLNTTITGACVADGMITHAIAERQSTQDRFTISAKVFVDCTGDGRLAAESGAPMREGRESQDEFGESSALPQADAKRLGSTLIFQARRHDRPMPFNPPPWARKFTEHDLRFRPHATGNLDLALEYGYWWVEWGGCLDTIKQNETIQDELLAILLGVWDHIKNGGEHGAERWALEWFGFLPGRRESRRVLGQYVLNESDLIESRPFDDAIAYGGWFIDTHPPEGIDAVDQPPCVQREVPHLYDIPLRACISRTIRNLMFCGRNLSATHLAVASTRVMATCAAIGQGVGTAAAAAVRQNRSPDELPTDGQAMRTIGQQLLRDDAFLIGRRNEMTDDWARRAAINASSHQPDGAAANVVSGQTRCVHGPKGAPSVRAYPSAHRWMSAPTKPLPAWIELRWPEAIRASQVQLIFDTGLHRQLTFSLANGYTAQMVWGRPQPETVRDYTIEAEIDGAWRELVRVEGNYQRRRVHPLDGRPLTAVRITVSATNGLDHARICEVRVFVA